VGVPAERQGVTDAPVTRAGFVALAGRPNVGKSTLVNAVVGEKVAITADRAQTTRRAIRGVRTEGECQLVVVDLPGVQRPRDALTARMARRVREELEGADAALLVLNGEQGVGPGDRFIARALVESMTRPTPVTVAVNKVDRLSRARTLEALRAAAGLELDGEVFPISACTGEGVGELVAHLATLMPEGPFLFAADEHSDQPPQLLAAELIREAAIRRTFQELPHALEVVVEEWADGRAADRSESGQPTGDRPAEPTGDRPKPGDTRLRPIRETLALPKPGDTRLRRESPLRPASPNRPASPFRPAEEVRVRALIWVESASQKGIVVGAQGRMIKAIGSAARRELQRELGCRVHLDLSVRVRRDWRGDEGLLDRLGIT
jgi:GTP-binding protein Era